MPEKPGPTNVEDSRREEARSSAGLRRFIGPLFLAGLLLLIYSPAVRELFQVLVADPNSSHGLLIPPLVALLVWRKRKWLAEAPISSNRWALLLVFGGAALLPLGKAAEIAGLPALSLLLVIGGIVWHIWGNRVMRILLFPYLFLFFTIPWPGLLVETLTFPMQLISAKAAALVLGLLGVAVGREGIELLLGNYTFAVGVPCSGMRSLAALTALGALCAFLLKGSGYRRGFLFLMVPPVALVGNAARIVVILLIALRWGTEAANGFYHQFSGLLLFLITFLLLLGIARLIGLKQVREDI